MKTWLARTARKLRQWGVLRRRLVRFKATVTPVSEGNTRFELEIMDEVILHPGDTMQLMVPVEPLPKDGEVLVFDRDTGECLERIHGRV